MESMSYFCPSNASIYWRVIYQPAEDTKIYDEVTEEQYKDVVRGRLQRDDFILDDGVAGYADNGMDDWEEPQVEYDSEEERKSKKSESVTNGARLLTISYFRTE